MAGVYWKLFLHFSKWATKKYDTKIPNLVKNLVDEVMQMADEMSTDCIYTVVVVAGVAYVIGKNQGSS